MKIESNLKVFLVQHKISQAAFGEKMGVLPQQVSNWVTGRATPALPLALKIAKELGTTVDEIWRLDE